MSLKILHTADWHLGKRYPQFPSDDEKKLTRARLDAVDHILDLAERYSVDAVLCAGDLFDDDKPDKEWWQGLAERLAKRDWTNRPLFFLPGNHDPLTEGSVWDPQHPFRRAAPDWVKIVDEDDYEYTFSDDAALYAAPCRSKAGAALTLPEREPGDERLRIGMLHGQTFDLEGHQTNFPIAEDAVVRAGLDYLAIGDTHAFRDVTPESAPTVYPGAPEPTAFRERDAGNVAIVRFRRRGRRPQIRREKVGRWTWREERVEEIAALRALTHEDLHSTVLKLTLALRVGLEENEEIEKILEELGGTVAAHGSVGVLIVDRDGLIVESAGLSDFPQNLPESLQSVVARLQAMESGELTQDAAEQETARRALVHLYRLVSES